MNWYQLNQNYADGYNLNFPKYYLIEAKSAKKANKIMDNIVDWNEGCDCCGLSWEKMTEENRLFGIDDFTKDSEADLEEWLEINKEFGKNSPYVLFIYNKDIKSK